MLLFPSYKLFGSKTILALVFLLVNECSLFPCFCDKTGRKGGTSCLRFLLPFLFLSPWAVLYAPLNPGSSVLLIKFPLFIFELTNSSHLIKGDGEAKKYGKGSLEIIPKQDTALLSKSFVLNIIQLPLFQLQLSNPQSKGLLVWTPHQWGTLTGLLGRNFGKGRQGQNSANF